MSSSFIHAIASVRISFLLKRRNNILVHVYAIFCLSIHLSLDMWIAFTFWLLWIMIYPLCFEKKSSLHPKRYSFIIVFHGGFEDSEMCWKTEVQLHCIKITDIPFLGGVHKIFLETFIWCRISSLPSSVFLDLPTVSVYKRKVTALSSGMEWYRIHLPVIFMGKTLFQGFGVLWDLPWRDAF